MRACATACLAALWALAGAGAQADCWRGDGGGGALEFTAWYEGQAVAGRFTDFQVRLQCDPQTQEPSAISVTVATGSADLDDEDANAQLREPAWFDIADFPRADYTSTALHSAPEGYIASGTLTLKGVSLPLQLPLDWRAAGASAQLSGAVGLSRLAWGIGSGEWGSDSGLADRVELRYRVTLVPAD